MSFIPKRIKDLPPLEPDSEDDRTPIKSKKEIVNCTIERFNTLPLRPKRCSELSVLLSDSEPENDEIKMNKIMNNSFIMNTSNEENFKSLIENDKNFLNEWDKDKYAKDTGYNSFAFNFKKSVIDDINNQVSEIKKDTKDDIKIQSRRPFSFLNKAKLRTIEGDGYSLFSLPEQANSPLEFSSKSKLPNIFRKIKEKTTSPTVTDSTIDNTNRSSVDNNSSKNSHIFNLKTLKSSHIGNQVLVTVNKDESQQNPLNNIVRNKNTLINDYPLNAICIDTPRPYNFNEKNFITPQVKTIRNFPSSQQPVNLGSTTQKNQSNNLNEIRSQKILFQTPYAVSRPPVSSITNYSISLGLDDTPTAPTDEINTPIKQNNKKTPEQLFKPPTEHNTEAVTVLSTETKKKEKIININQKEYVILKKLGSGGSSSVFLAQRKDTKEECALKIVDLRGDKLVVEGYLNETKLLAKLQGNINVVTLFEYEHIEAKSTLFMVMEKGDSDLYKILQSYKKDLPLHILMNYWHQILLAVDYIHQNGVIHSDLKPANFLMINNRLKLIDFGIASRIPNDTTSIIKFSQAGTFNYISPEALTDTSTGNSPYKDQPKIKISTKSDVWSLGCILYLFLYKKTPFGHVKNSCAKANLISSSNTVIEYPKLSYYYPPMLVEMAQKCLVHNPKERISVAELLKYPFNMVIPV